MRHVARKGLFSIAAAGGMLVAAGAAAQADAGAEGVAQNSPGIGSGNTVQVPVNAPVNACGNSVNAGGLLNPAFGNTCVNDGGGTKSAGGQTGVRSGQTGSQGGQTGSQGGQTGSQGGQNGTQSGQADTQSGPTRGNTTGGGAHAQGLSSQSPGVLSGNTVQVPVDVPVNACGNSANLIGLGNAVFGNECANGAIPKPPRHEAPPEEPDRPDVADTPERSDTPDRPEERRTPPKHETHVAPVPAEKLAETGSEIPLGAIVPISGGLLLGGAVLYRRARASAA
ncbi:chaplin [Streptomyces sp. WMMC500]|uniref:chaplin n=1 Tax=Streptomyces sp. WMMC500 TaxID=3015154 RepID=UPI00248C20DB|nr:chaplin [Streptomyces sp. WMMC500]WBB60302.1 chaplin [Streptomyces sp. WMMC500]